MSAVLPDPPVLDMPEEDPHALADAVAAVSGGSFHLGVLASHLAGPAATAPGWLGEDAAAAAAQVGAVAEVARDAQTALGSAANRLLRHADLLADTRRAIAALRTEQDDDYAAAAVRLADVVTHAAVPTSPAQPAVIVVLGDELRTANATRLRRHGALLAQLRADAVDTARVLGAAAAAVGGTGRPGDGDRVLVGLAVRLPGWGDGELSVRGAELARLLLGPETRQELETRAEAALPYARSAAFADALLRVLGADGLRSLLLVLPVQGLDPGSATARLLALALGSATRGGGVVDPVGEVLDATYVRERAPGTDDDLVALGLATVLAAAAPTGPGAIPAATVARWGGQVFRREEWWRAISPAAARAGERAGPMYADAPDPVREVIRLLAAAGNPSAAVSVVPDLPSWDLVVGRPELAVYDDAALRRLVELVGAAPGAAGGASVRAGLEALGAGMTTDDPNHWQVARSMADTLAVPLSSALARHPDALAGVLLPAAGQGAPSVTDAAALRALGYLTVDPQAAGALSRSVAAWARDHADQPGAASMPVAPLLVGSFVAVREFGQRLVYAMHGFEARDAARAAQILWNATVGLAVNALPNRVAFFGLLEPIAAHRLGYDGTWDDGRDDGLVFGRADAAAVARAEVEGPPGRSADVVGSAAAAGFDRTSRVLGLPLPPVSSPWIWWKAELDALPFPEPLKMLTDEDVRRLRGLLDGADGEP